MVCTYCHSAHLFSSSAQKLSSSISPFAPSWYPTGCCIHASVATIKNPDSHDPSQTRNAAHQCPTRPSFFSPNKNNPRKLDSRKNENTPSIARVCPMTPPAVFENAAQLVPNWNSIGIPVTTPSAKLIPRIRAQNRVDRL